MLNITNPFSGDHHGEEYVYKWFHNCSLPHVNVLLVSKTLSVFLFADIAEMKDKMTSLGGRGK